MKEKMYIRVLGCVACPGPLSVDVHATVGHAVKQAGGFGGQGMHPTGVIAVRSPRKKDGLYYQRRALNYLRCPDHVEVTLRPDDLVIVQFDVDSRQLTDKQKENANKTLEFTSQ